MEAEGKIVKKFKKWLVATFLPTWVRERLEAENTSLREENERLRQKNRLLNAYIDGLEAAIKAQKKIVIHTTGEVPK